MKKQYLYKLSKTSKRVASVLSAIALGFGNQLLLPQVGLTQTAGVGIGALSLTHIDDGCFAGGTPDQGDTISIATNLTNTTGTNREFRVVFRATSTRGGSTRTLSEDLFYGGPTYMNKTPSVGGSNWDDSYGQVTNTPTIANGGSYTVRANFGLNQQQLANALGLGNNVSTSITLVAEVFSSDFSTYYGRVSAPQTVLYRGRNGCPTGTRPDTTAFVLNANKTTYTTSETITIEQSTLGANDTTIFLPSWGDGASDIIDIIRLDTPPTGNPETDYANNFANVATSLSSWPTTSQNTNAATSSSTDEKATGTFNYSHIVGSTLTAWTNYASFSASTLVNNRYYMVRVRPRLGTTGTNTNAGTSSHPVLRAQYTYFAVGTPAPVGASANLGITKTHTGNFTVGQNGTYTLTVSNAGPTAAAPITVTDTLPTGMSFVSGTGTGWSCTASGQTVTCTNTNGLASGASSAITLTVSVGANTAASVTNTATVTSTTPDPNSSNNTANDPTTVIPSADLSITKDDGKTTVLPGSAISYTIIAKNNGPSGITGAVVTDTVPNTITGVSWTCVASTGSSCGAANGTGNAINTTANLLSGGTATYTVTGTLSPSASGTLSNTASIALPAGTTTTDPNTTNNSATDSDTITPVPDLTITKSHTGNFTQAGTGTYSITVTNSGTAPTSGTVTVTDTLPTGLTFPNATSATGTGWTCTISGQTVTCTRSDALAAGTSYPPISLNVAVASNAPSSITNVANVSGGGEINTTNDSASDPTTINVYQISALAGKVIINEVLYAQTGATAATNDEFIEIYNASNSTVDLSGWKLMDGNIIANSTDGTGSITGNSSPYTFPSGTTLAAGQYAVIWIGNNTSTNQATGATFQAWLGQSASLNNTGDDIWLYDSQTAIVDYIAYGSGSAINTPPPTSLNLWNTTYQTSLAGASTGQSISLTANGQDGNASACWEPTTSGQANGRCTGYLPTRDTDTVGVRVTTVGQNNNGALAPLLLLVKRITAINTTSITSFVDDPTSTNDNSTQWPTPTSSYLKGAIDGGAVKPGDTVEYTIYFLSDGGSSAQKVNMCDLVPANTTFLPDAFASGSGIAQATGSAAPVNLTNAADTDGGQYVTAGSSLPTGVSCNNSNTNGAAIVNLGNIPNAIGAGSPSNSYGFIRFRVKVK